MFLFILFSIIFAQSAFASPIVKITNFSSNTLPEWIEIHNETPNLIDLTNWKIGDSNTTVLYDITLSGCLSANSYLTIYQPSALLNNDGDIINLYNSTNELIDQLVYTEGKVDNSPQSTNTCIPSPTPTIPSSTPTSSLTPTATRTPTLTHTPAPTSTPSTIPSVTPTPIPSSTKTPTPTRTPTLTPEPTVVIEPTPSDLILDMQSTESTNDMGINDLIMPTPTNRHSKFTLSPAIISFGFIGLGGLLLLIPVVMVKLNR